MGLATALAATAAAAGITGAAMSGGGGGGGGKLELSPEEELQMIRRSQRDLAQIDRDIQRSRKAEKIYKKQLDIAKADIAGMMPSEESVKQLDSLTFDLAKTLGKDARSLVQEGFIDEASGQALAEMQALEGDGTVDLKTKQQIEDDRQRYASALRKRGITGSQFDREMARFDNEASVLQQQADESLRTSKSGRIGQRLEGGLLARQTNFDIASGEFDLLSGEATRLRDARNAGIEGQVKVESERLLATERGIETRSGLRGEGQGIFESLGNFNRSAKTKDLLEAGVIGPGSFYDQTGVARRSTEGFKNTVADAEKEITNRYIDAARSGDVPGYPGNNFNYGPQDRKRQLFAGANRNIFGRVNMRRG